MNNVLISACLLGKRVRYDENALTVTDKILNEWLSDGRVVSICPEVAADMCIPRPPAEISKGDGRDVLAGNATVIESTGIDVTDHFKSGAQIALSLCQKNNIKIAVLAESSPSCGSSTIYDGSFSGEKIVGFGVTAALLIKNGIQVFNQYEMVAANKALQRTSR